MSQALWLLIRLQLRGWLRYLGRSLRSLRGALLALVGFSVFACWLLPVLFVPAGSGVSPEQLQLYGPGALVLYCLVNVLLSSGERAVYFTPAEVNFLFTGPFGRREVLGYKIVSTLLIGLPTTLLMAAFMHGYARWFPAAYVGLLLMFAFMQLFSMAVSLVATSVGARLYTRGRKLVLAVVLALGVVVLIQSGAFAPGNDPRALARQVAETPLWQIATTPLRWFFDAFLATRLWPDLVVSALLALLVDLVLVGVVMALDAHYLETSAAASARIYARIQRIRRAGLAGASSAEGGPARLSLPMLPYWGGVGPTLWRQLTIGMRGLGRLLVVLAILSVVILLPLMSDTSEEAELGPKLMGILPWLTVFLTTLVPFDFRGDLDRLAFLKTLPVAAWRLAVGELLTPVLLLTTVQWVVLAVVFPFAPESAFWLGALAAYALPFNFLLFALENLLFLLFPTRLVAATPGDFQGLGRNVLFLMAKVATLGVVTLFAVGVGALTWWLTGRNLAAGVAAAWPVVALAGAALVPMVALAFRAFDVGRDTPA